MFFCSVDCPENVYFEKSDWKHFKNPRIKRGIGIARTTEIIIFYQNDKVKI